jgi:exosortase
MAIPYRYAAAGFGLAALLLWCYWTSLGDVADRWANDPQHAQGYLVPVFALAILWARRGSFPARPLRGTWWAVPVALAAVGSRLAGTYYFLEWPDLASILLFLTAGLLAAGGWPLLRWAAPAVLLLGLMMPLPHRLESAVSNPLRRFSTSASAYVMQTLGMPAVAEENIILVDQLSIGVVEACSGLGMLVTLLALTVTVTFFIDRPRWEKAVLVASALPIAVAANVLRITLTGVLTWHWSSEAAAVFFHDLAGWVMMPVALLLLWLEGQVLSRLLIEDQRPVGELFNLHLPPGGAR